MPTEDLPNGFTGFARKKPGFVSAADALRQQSLMNDQKPERKTYGAPDTTQTFQYGRDHADDMDNKPQMPFDLSAVDEIGPMDRRWAWVQIDLSAIRHNVQETKRKLARGVRLCAVVKADAYGSGHGRRGRRAAQSGHYGPRSAVVPAAPRGHPPAFGLSDHAVYLRPGVRGSIRGSGGCPRHESPLPSGGEHRHEPHRRALRRSGGLHAAHRVPSCAGARRHFHAFRHRRLPGNPGLPNSGEAVLRGRAIAARCPH